MSKKKKTNDGIKNLKKEIQKAENKWKKVETMIE